MLRKAVLMWSFIVDSRKSIFVDVPISMQQHTTGKFFILNQSKCHSEKKNSKIGSKLRATKKMSNHNNRCNHFIPLNFTNDECLDLSLLIAIRWYFLTEYHSFFPHFDALYTNCKMIHTYKRNRLLSMRSAPITIVTQHASIRLMLFNFLAIGK